LKYRNVLLIVFLILLADQAFKFYIKLNFFYSQETNVIGHWFRLHFIENSGMAFGMEFGKKWGKLFLTLFRLIAVCFGFWFIYKELVLKKYSKGLLVCSAMILAGAMGNLIDSIFYGKIFSESSYHKATLVPWGQGYGDLFYGKVVDMLYFPLFDVQIPNSWPILGGKFFTFFQPVFNIADSSIFLGVFILLLFQKRFIHQPLEQSNA